MAELEYTIRHTTGGIRFVATGPRGCGKSLLRGKVGDIIRAHGGTIFENHEDDDLGEDILVASLGSQTMGAFRDRVAKAAAEMRRQPTPPLIRPGVGV